MGSVGESCCRERVAGDGDRVDPYRKSDAGGIRYARQFDGLRGRRVEFCKGWGSGNGGRLSCRGLEAEGTGAGWIGWPMTNRSQCQVDVTIFAVGRVWGKKMGIAKKELARERMVESTSWRT